MQLSAAPNSAQASSQPQPKADERSLNDFITLSRDLTGEANLDPGLARAYLERFRETFGGEILAKLIDQHKCPRETQRIGAVSHAPFEISGPVDP